MKKKLLFAILILGILLIPILAMGATVFKTTNSITVAWDPVTVPAGSTAQYQVYIRTDPAGTGVASGNPITPTQATVTFTVEGLYDIGVKAQRMVAGAVVSESTISWSNDPLVCQGGAAFGAQYYNPPPAATNLRSP
jgi:hypothetical protein